MVHEIMRWARGLGQRQLEAMRHLWDEKSFKHGQSCITLLTCRDESRVLDVVEERIAAAGRTGNGRHSSAEAETKVWEAVAVEMWEPFITTIEKQRPRSGHLT